MIYLFIKLLSSLALPFYFCKWQISGKEKIPGGPVIFVANHRNAFLDAVLIACSSSKNPWFITRADVFRKPFVKKMLSVLQMVPVYRFRDGFGSMKQNGEVISSCVSKMNSNHSILIFPEGNHGTAHRLRPLQKGVARIALSDDLTIEPFIVPVGLYYESLSDFRSRVLVNFGEPFKADGMNDVQLLREMHDRMKHLILHIDEERYDDQMDVLRSGRNLKKDMYEQLKTDQNYVMISNKGVQQPAKTTGSSPGLIEGYVRLNLFPSSFIIHHFILPGIKDPQFRGSVKFAVGMFLVPLMLMLQGSMLYMLSGQLWVSLLYLVSVLLTVKFRCRTELK